MRLSCSSNNEDAAKVRLDAENFTILAGLVILCCQVKFCMPYVQQCMWELQHPPQRVEGCAGAVCFVT